MDNSFYRGTYKFLSHFFFCFSRWPNVPYDQTSTSSHFSTVNRIPRGVILNGKVLHERERENLNLKKLILLHFN